MAPPAGPGGTKYYDDNDWVGIEMVRLYQLTHNAALLGSAEGIMAFEMAGWQERPGLACEGGIPFSNDASNGERNTVTTAPAAQLGALLYRYTHNVAVPAVRGKSVRVGAQLACSSRRTCTRTTSATTAWSNRRCGATTRAR